MSLPAVEPGSIRIALAQIGTQVGDCIANADRVIETIKRAKHELNARVVVFPELTLTGYPPEDLLLRDDFLTQCSAQIERIAAAASDIAVVIGAPLRLTLDSSRLINAAIVIDQGQIIAQYA
ncbi:MAG TPA: nitrilase-related carbon-nitrogen hydrolase, partial [Halothiobacillus sp.]